MTNALHDFYSVVDTSAKNSLVRLARFLILLNSGRNIIRAHYPSL